MRRRWRGSFQELGLLVVIAVLFVLLSVFGHLNATGRYANLFLNFDNLFNGVATNMAIYAIMGVGVTLVIITGGIDLSVGSVWALAAIITAWVMRVPLEKEMEGSVWVVVPQAIAIAGGVGLVCGLINGLLVVGLRLHPFIVTLGTMSIFRGLTNVLSPEKTLPGQGGILPYALTEGFIQWDFGIGLRLMPMLITLTVVAGGWFYLSQTVAGRQTYAVGGNPEAARYAGLPINRVLLRAYALAGLTAGIAGLVSLGRFGAVSTNSGMGDELTVIAGCVVGGSSLSGGRGTALGTMLGALVIALIENGIFVVRLDQEYRSIIIGAAIIVAVMVDRFSASMRERRLRMAR